MKTTRAIEWVEDDGRAWVQLRTDDPDLPPVEIDAWDLKLTINGGNGRMAEQCRIKGRKKPPPQPIHDEISEESARA